MKSLEKRIMQVSEMVAENLFECALDFRHNNHCGIPSKRWRRRWKELNTNLDRVTKIHGLNDTLINRIRSLESATAYTIGIIAGMQLSGRQDLIPKVADLYAQNTIDGEMWDYDDNGDSILPAKH